MVTILNKWQCFGGQQLRCSHFSEVLHCDMHFSIYIPSGAEPKSMPVLWWLSGLTCTDENFVQKSGFQRYAAEHKVIVVAPDTSPRGDEVPDDEQGAWDFGLGAGFYLNATQAPWKQHYQMYSYVVDELPKLVEQHFDLGEVRGISGHSMGGHGALSIALKNPERYQSVSAFAPICAPSQVPWGHKALGHYLGDDRDAWQGYDSCELIKVQSSQFPMILVDQGADDSFMEEQLKPELLRQACEASGQALELNMREGYDHSYFFVASFIGEHIRFHASQLRK